MAIDSNELLGYTLGNCVLHRLLGQGGMGAVYQAQQLRPRRVVAIKVLMPGTFTDGRPHTEFLARFRREANAVAALDHVNIMPIYEYGEQDELAYLVMPYVTGGTLRDRLDQHTTLPVTTILPIIEQVATGLDYAHTQGIIHRDLKPANILFHADGRVLIADFGLAKIMKDAAKAQHTDSTPSLQTSVGTIVGTPEYLSPEQARGGTIDYRTDVYSLGIVLFQMFTGHVPFTGISPVAVAIKHAMEPPPQPSQLNPSISPAIEAVIMKAMEKKPEQRFASAGELVCALRTAIEDARYHHPVGTDITKHATLPVTPSPVILHDDNTEQLVENADGHDIHSITTEEAPRVVPSEPAHIDTFPTVVTPPIKERATPRQKITETPSNNTPARRQGFQSAGMMLLGSLLTLVLVISGFITYFYLTPNIHKAALSDKSTPVVRSSTVTPIPNFRIRAEIPAGQQLYATASPGETCDIYGAQWSSLTNATLHCTSRGLELTNTGTQHLAGTFLNALPHQQPFPTNYILQVQVAQATNSQGNFGVIIRNQPGQQQGAYSFLLSPNNLWNAYVYANQTGVATQLHGDKTIQPLQGTITIDVVVSNNTFQLYINGIKQGYIQSGLYTNGTIGLVADVNADIYFQNLAIYALP